MPRPLARSAYGTSRRIGEAGISIARLESLTFNATPLTLALRLTSSGGRSPIHPEPPRIRLLLGKIAHRIYQSFPFVQALKKPRRNASTERHFEHRQRVPPRSCEPTVPTICRPIWRPVPRPEPKVHPQRFRVLLYCVANMPGAVPRTSTFALTNATLPYALKLANKGFRDAVTGDPGLAAGVNTYDGKLTYEAVALSQGREYTPLDQLLERKVSEVPA